jgi:hypothetical protein
LQSWNVNCIQQCGLRVCHQKQHCRSAIKRHN